MAKHALLSASGAHRWLECTPSALLELQFPQTTSEYAEEGTAAHELCELTARYFLGEVSEMDFENRRDELAKGPYYNAEMQECANDYARFVTEKTKAAQESCEDAFTELEVRVDFSKYVKDGFGTGDCIIVADKVLEIVDFKYGKGVRVEATGNPQMKLYALGALLKYNTLFDIDSVRMTIFQPRLSGIQSSDEITVKELLEWAEKYVKPRAKLAYKGEGEFAPSEEVCKFCRAKAQCKARADKNLKLFDEAPDAINGEDEEATETLRLRYLNSFENQSYGFNRGQYIEVIEALPGVGGCKPYRAWKGPGTVKLVITGSDYQPPSDTLINTVQTTIDPTQNSGDGIGLAPIDHEVTVVGAAGTAVNISTTLTFASGWNLTECLPYIQSALDAYYLELNSTWSKEAGLIVRVSQIESRLLALAGIVDISGTTLNGQAGNLTLDKDAVAVRGSFTNA